MREEKEPKTNLLDQAIAYVAPIAALKRKNARRFLASSSYYNAGSRRRPGVHDYSPSAGSANSTMAYSLDLIRNRSRDLSRNAPLAIGAISTTVTNVVGHGLKLNPRPDRTFLNLSDDEADAWEFQAQRLWHHYTKHCDLSGRNTFNTLQGLALWSRLDAGDLFVQFVNAPQKNQLFATKLNLIEADRCSNPNGMANNPNLFEGVELNDLGQPTAYHISLHYPHDPLDRHMLKWVRVPKYGAQTGRPLILHLMEGQRPGQARGLPLLTPVVEALKQLVDYTDAELQAAVLNSCIAITTTSAEGNILPSEVLGGETSEKKSLAQTPVRLKSGTIIEGFAPGEEIKSFASERPNSNFENFAMAITRQIAVALDLSHEVLIRHFTASYSASRAALQEVWKHFKRRRAWLAESLCQPVYEEFLHECVNSGLLKAPGWDDVLTREAWCRATWIGPSASQLDPVKEVNAAKERIAVGISTIEQETAEMNAGDWEENHWQRVKEVSMRREGGLTPQPDDITTVSQPIDTAMDTPPGNDLED